MHQQPSVVATYLQLFAVMVSQAKLAARYYTRFDIQKYRKCCKYSNLYYFSASQSAAKTERSTLRQNTGISLPRSENGMNIQN